jgi:hypothetical protein
MAMIKCPECGRDISDAASACPGCGAPVRKAGCMVRFERPSAIILGTAVSGMVYVDGQSVGSAATGANFEVYLSYGQHSVSIESNDNTRIASHRSSVDTLDVPKGAKKVVVTIKTKGDVWSAFGGATRLGIGNVEVIR